MLVFSFSKILIYFFVAVVVFTITIYSSAKLTDKFHILPYFHGNRSPIANSSLRGIISGLSLAETVDDLAVVYLATVQAIAVSRSSCIYYTTTHLNKK